MTLLRDGGIDIFYIDESVRHPHFFAAAVRIPFLRMRGENWTFVWEEAHNQADKWRRTLSKRHNIKFRQELHAHEILARKGLLHRSGRNLTHDEAYALYADALQSLTFIEPASILTVSSKSQSVVLGNKGMDACMHAMFQRIKLQTDFDRVNGLLFFDEGHKE